MTRTVAQAIVFGIPWTLGWAFAFARCPWLPFAIVPIAYVGVRRWLGGLE